MVQLPTELWVRIIEFATSVPSELNVNASSLFERCSHTDAQKGREMVLPTRRALPLVSHAFHEIANPRLYKSILIRRVRTARALLDTLESAPKLKGHAYLSKYGQWIRRLDINQNGQSSKRWLGPIFGQLRYYLPNLEIFTQYGGYWTTSDDLLGAASSYFLNIKVIRLHRNTIGPLSITLDKPFISSLRSFSPPALISILVNQPVDVPDDHDQGGNIRFLVVREGDKTKGHVDPCYFPHLRTLQTIGHMDTEVLEVHGHKITTLDLQETNWSAVSAYLEYLPNLRSVILDIMSLIPYTYHHHQLGSTFLTQTKIDLVGLTLKAVQAPWKEFAISFQIIPMIFPDVKRLRILERRTVDHLAITLVKRAYVWQSALAAQGIRLEREDGELLLA